MKKLVISIALFLSGPIHAAELCTQVFTQSAHELNRGPFLKNKVWESLQEAMASVPLDSEAQPLFYKSDLWNDIKQLSQSADRAYFNIKPKVYAESFKHPKYILMTGGFGYGRFTNNLVMLHGDIIVEGYFRNRFFSDSSTQIEREKTFADFKATQPWFEFNEKSQTYRLRTDGITERLISHLPKDAKQEVTLFRGLKQIDELHTIKIAQQIRSSVGDRKSVSLIVKDLIQMQKTTNFESLKSAIPEVINKIKSGEIKTNKEGIIAELLRARFDGVAAESFFSTPDKNVALSYGGDNPLLKIEVSPDVLRKLADKNNLYAGVEYEYFEIMFRGSDSIHSILDQISFVH